MQGTMKLEKVEATGAEMSARYGLAEAWQATVACTEIGSRNAEIAAEIALRLNSHEGLVEALRGFVSRMGDCRCAFVVGVCDSCGYEYETGKARAALAQLEVK
jgi:hypothetical protein